MFYSYELLCRQHGGRFASIWLLATNRRVSDTSIMKIDISKTAQEIIDVINHYPEHLPKSAQTRFSLYLSSMLMCGCLRAYKRKVIIVLREAVHVSSIKKQISIDAESPKKKHLLKQGQPLAQKEAVSKEVGEQINVLQQLELLPVPCLLSTEGTFLERDESRLKNEQLQVTDISAQALSLPPQGAQSITMATNGRSMEDMNGNALNEGIIVSKISEVHNTQIHPVEPAAIEMLAECLESVKALESETVGEPVEPLNIATTYPTNVQHQVAVPPDAAVDRNQSTTTQHMQREPQSGSIVLQPIENVPIRKQRKRKRLTLDEETKIDSKIICRNVETIDIALRAKDASEDIITVEKYPKGPQMLTVEGYKKLGNTLHQLFKRHAVTHQREAIEDIVTNKGISFSTDMSLRCEETLSWRMDSRSTEAFLNISQSPRDVTNITRIAPEVVLETIAEERMPLVPSIDDSNIEKGLSSHTDFPIPPAEISTIVPIPAPSIVAPGDNIPLPVHEQSLRLEPLNENDIKCRLMELWENRVVVDFTMLCPPECTSRLVAAKAFDTILVMHANRSVRLDQRIRNTPPHFPTGPIYIDKP